MSEDEPKSADLTSLSIQAAPLLAEALAQDEVASVTGDVHHFGVLKNRTMILLDQMTNKKDSYEMRTELLYKYFYNLTRDWTAQNSKFSLSEMSQKGIKINGVIDCCFCHAIDTEWSMQGDECKDHLYKSLKRLKEIVEEDGIIAHLLDVCCQPWTSKAIKDVLSRTGANRETLNVLLTQESPSVRTFRLETLVQSNLPKLAFNYGKFIIESEFFKSRSINGFKTANEEEDTHLCRQISIFITLAVRLKKSRVAISMVLDMPRQILHALLLVQFKEICNDNANDEHRDAVKLICNCVFHLINQGCYARAATVAIIKEMFELPLIHDEYLRIVAENCQDSTAAYLIAKCMWNKYAQSRLSEVLRLFNRGLNADLNMAEIFKAKLEKEKDKKEEAVKTLNFLNGTMAEAYGDLAIILSDQDIWYRECILTSFSLAPSHSLLEEIEKCAERAYPKSIGETERSSNDGDTDKSLASEASVAWNTRSPIDMVKFNNYCQGLELSLGVNRFSRGVKSLKNDGTTPTADSKTISANSENTLDGLLSIEGSVLTSSSSYNPLADPMSAFFINDVPMKLISDLLIVVNSPRWHLLSWVHPWKVLRERCQQMLQSPLNRGTQELKYLVIDYTQFDDWSSDEEFEIVTGIEPGYESWEELSDDDEEEK